MFIHCQGGRWREKRNWSTRRGFFYVPLPISRNFFSFLLKSTLECKASCYPLCKREKSELAYTPNNFVVLISCNWSKIFFVCLFQVREHERAVERLRQQYEDCLQDVRKTCLSLDARDLLLPTVRNSLEIFTFSWTFSFCPQMQQRNTAVVDMEAKLSDMKSKSDEYTDKVWSCFWLFSCWHVLIIFRPLVILWLKNM